MPGKVGGIEARKPLELLNPKARMTVRDGNVRSVPLHSRISDGLPGCASRAFQKTEGFIKMHGFGVVGADVEPDVVNLTFAGVLHGAQGEGAGDSTAAVIRVDGNIGDEVEAVFVPSEGHEADVADDATVFLPHIAGERQGGGIGGAFCPLQKGVVAPGAAHVLHVAFAVAIHGGREAGLDQVRDGGQIPQDAEGADVGVGLRVAPRGEGDACHGADYRLEIGKWGVDFGTREL